jgi:hypothetical protein
MPKISVVTCNKKAENLISEQLKNIKSLKFYPDTIHMLKDKNTNDTDLIIYDACNNKFAKEDISILLEKEKGKKIFILSSKKYPIENENFGENIFVYTIPDEVAQFIKDLNKFVYPEKKLLDKEINKAVHNFESFKDQNGETCDNSDKKIKKEEKKQHKEEKKEITPPSFDEEIKLKIADLTKQKISTSSIDISFSINRDKIEEIIINYIINDIMSDIRENMDEITESIRDSIKEKILLMIENELKEEIKNRTLETSNEIVSSILQNKLASMFNGSNS